MKRSSRHDRAAPSGGEELSGYSTLAELMDRAFRIPGTRIRFGLDAIIGLIPGAGDLLTAFVGTYGLWIARKLGVPASIQGRMLMNLGIDALVGAVPLLGDVFDVAFKAHIRNKVLLERWLATPHKAQRSSLVMLIAAIAALFLICGGVVWITILAFRWIFTTLQSA